MMSSRMYWEFECCMHTHWLFARYPLQVDCDLADGHHSEIISGTSRLTSIAPRHNHEPKMTILGQFINILVCLVTFLFNLRIYRHRLCPISPHCLSSQTIISPQCPTHLFTLAASRYSTRRRSPSSSFSADLVPVSEQCVRDATWGYRTRLQCALRPAHQAHKSVRRQS